MKNLVAVLWFGVAATALIDYFHVPFCFDTAMAFFSAWLGLFSLAFPKD